MTKSHPARLLALAVLGAIALRAVLLALNAVPFNADEAIVALMARHILHGERPWFFYGQAYMGSLDAYLVAGAFTLLGESVLTVRVVQTVLFAATLLTSYFVAHRITNSRHTALLTVLLLAFPPVLLTLYTTVSLGGYGEALLIGNLLLWLGHRLGREGRDCPWLWLAWGVTAGLGFWAFGLVLVYALPAGLWLLRRWARRPGERTSSRLMSRASCLASLALGFILGSLPWWLGNLNQLEMGAAELFGTAVRSTATAGTFLGNVVARVFNFFVLGLPVLFGLRFPWRVGGPPIWLGVPALALYLGALGRAARQCRKARPDYVLLWGIWGMLLIGFVLTPFGGDPSGRYFLPLYLPLSIFAADALAALQERAPRWTWMLLGLVLAFNLVGTAQAALANPPGITTQFDPISQVDHRSYGALMDFLRAHGETRGYSNYWIAYPLAFLSQEEIILVPRLPYKADLRYTSRDDRYAPYGEMVEASATAVYVTSNHPALDDLLREQFTDLGVGFREKQISSYHVFYGLSRHVRPIELSIRPGE
jgi:4-amino-4-deoxy-L-arabinose transferase-like glycosyltransferase